MEVSFESLVDRTDAISQYINQQVEASGHDCYLGTDAYLELVHLLADWPAYAGLLRVLLEGSQVSGNAVLGLL